jgi:acetolactate synthase-1/2/3 large subunit
MIRQKITPAQQSRCQARSQQLQNEHQQMREKWSHLATAKAVQKPISPEWLCHCINEVIDENTIVLEETLTNRAILLRQIHRTRPGTFFRSGGSNLGWGLQSALGTKLASPDATVVTIVGDGSFVFGCPTATLWAASTYHIPFLAIILNNMQYHAPKLTLRQALGTDSFSEKSGKWVGIDIKPPPDYAAIARACHAYGQMVEDPSEIQQALKQALEQVRNGKAAVLDVRLENP